MDGRGCVTLLRGGFADLTLSGSPEGPTIFLANGFFPSDPFPIAGPRVDLTEQWFEYQSEEGVVLGVVVLLSASYSKTTFKSIVEIMNHHHHHHHHHHAYMRRPNPNTPTCASINTGSGTGSGSGSGTVCKWSGGGGQEVLHVCDVLLLSEGRQECMGGSKEGMGGDGGCMGEGSSSSSSRLVYDVRKSHPWMSLELFHREMTMSTMMGGLELCT